jgi:hypothetical protein
MFGAFDKTFCANRACEKSERCGRSVKRLDGQKAIIAMSAFAPDRGGHCDMEEPYREYQVPEWMTKLAEEEEEKYAVEQARRQELMESGGLDSDSAANNFVPLD